MGYVGDQGENREHHVESAAVLALFAVHPAEHLQLIESPLVCRLYPGPDGAERVEPFRPGPLLLGPLQVPRGHVIDAGDPRNAGAGLLFRGAPEPASDDHPDLPLELHLL